MPLRIRDPTLLSLSLLILAGSSMLGLLVHDGAIGVDTSAALHVSDGEWLRLKGETAAPNRTWPEEVNDALLAHTVRLEADGLDAMVLVTSDEELPDDGVWVITGRVRAVLEDLSIVVLEAERLSDPVWFK